jgi:nicotinate-nucleotide adenylyltransferase
MLRIAISQYDGLELDEREILRQGVSYTIDTLRSLRSDIGPQAALCFVLGFDSYRTLNEWQRWQELSDVAHLLVLARPGFSAALPAEIALWASDKMVDEASRMMESPCGNICCVELVQLEISATEIRQMIAAGGSPEEMTTQGVIDYIRQQGLYRC